MKLPWMGDGAPRPAPSRACPDPESQPTVPSTPHRIDDLSITLSADPALIHDVRERFADWLDSWAAGAIELRNDLMVVLSELLANAAAAAPDDGAELVVHAWCEGDDVVVEVSNPVAPWVDAAIRWDLNDPLRPGGRGLLIVRALVDEVEVVQDVDDSRTTLRCRRATV